jgi:hypothetical protein
MEPTQASVGLGHMVSNWPLNRLLLALPVDDLERLMPTLEHIACQREQVLVDADGSLDYIYFPDSGVISVVAVYANGDIIEMATIAEGRLQRPAGCLWRQRSSGQLWSNPRHRREIRALHLRGPSSRFLHSTTSWSATCRLSSSKSWFPAPATLHTA